LLLPLAWVSWNSPTLAVVASKLMMDGETAWNM
jgi:hypothetical protein